jgi:MFS family permease
MFWMAVLLMAGSQGFFPLVWATVGEAFGRRSFGAIRGTASAFQVVPSSTMPILAGLLYDWTGGYTLALWITFLLAGISSALLLLTPRVIYVKSQPQRTVLAAETPLGT